MFIVNGKIRFTSLLAKKLRRIQIIFMLLESAFH